MGTLEVINTGPLATFAKLIEVAPYAGTVTVLVFEPTVVVTVADVAFGFVMWILSLE